MPHIEQQFHVSWRTEPVTEAQHFNAHQAGIARRAEPFEQQPAQRMHRVLRGIHHLISQLADWLHRLTLIANGVRQSAAAFRRMRASRFTKAPSENFIRSFEEYD